MILCRMRMCKAIPNRLQEVRTAARAATGGAPGIFPWLLPSGFPWFIVAAAQIRSGENFSHEWRSGVKRRATHNFQTLGGMAAIVPAVCVRIVRLRAHAQAAWLFFCVWLINFLLSFVRFQALFLCALARILYHAHAAETRLIRDFLQVFPNIILPPKL